MIFIKTYLMTPKEYIGSETLQGIGGFTFRGLYVDFYIGDNTSIESHRASNYENILNNRKRLTKKVIKANYLKGYVDGY